MLYVLATPIGNLSDLSERAKTLLANSSLIIAENPGYSKRLLDVVGFTGKMPKFMQLADHNEEVAIPAILERLKKENGVLISDAGTPGISDPGFKLVREAVKSDLVVSAIPGPNAAIAALSASGLPTDKFLFLGFVPKTEIKLTNQLEKAKLFEATIIFYESPHRIIKTLGYIQSKWPEAKIVIARELTKIHEEFIRGPAAEIFAALKARQSLKGEFTVLLSFK